MNQIKVLFASAEASPIARVGGLAEASAGLIRALRVREDVEPIVVLPDYDGFPLEGESVRELHLPDWASPASLRSGTAPQLGEVHLVSVPGMAKPNPYVDAAGTGWADNTERFFGFSAAVAALVDICEPDVLHLNDWHTALALAWTEIPSVYTIHTLGYQGETDIGWLRDIPGDRAAAFDRYGTLNPAAGAIKLADRVVAVSPNYADEILDPARSAGLHALLEARGSELLGIRNGIDSSIWSPESDPMLSVGYSSGDPSAKTVARDALLDAVGWESDDRAVVGMVTRLVDQKGLDIALGLVPYLERMGARLVLLGSGDERLALWARDLAGRFPDQLHFTDGYDVRLAHQIFAGSDLFLMPSRFEPCGLAQMQAMAYGSIPVVTPVGGLVDTVVDADDPESAGAGNGFMALTVDGVGVLDALHRAVAGWRDLARRRTIQRTGMVEDWSWEGPADQHVTLYKDISRPKG